MDAVRFLKEKNRMCSHYKEDCNGGCPAFILSNCSDPKDDEIKLIINIVEQWSKNHPRKTILQDFLEKHPKAPRKNDGLPKCCPYYCGYSDIYDCFGSEINTCFNCWNRPMED